MAQEPRLRFVITMTRASAVDHRQLPTPPPGVSFTPMLLPLTSRLGVTAGASYDLPIAGSVGLRPELRYAQRGWATEYQFLFDDPTAVARVTTNLDVIELAIPARLTFRFGRARATLLAGPALGIRVRCFVLTTGYSNGRTACRVPPFRSAQPSVTAGLEVEPRIGGGLVGAMVRYTRGLADPVDIAEPSGLIQQAVEVGASLVPGAGLGRWLGRAGRVSVGIRGGWNQATEEVRSTAQIVYLERLPVQGLHAGILARLRLAPMLAVQTEAVFSQEGTAWLEDLLGNVRRVEYRLGFIQTPLLMVVSTPAVAVSRALRLRPYVLGGPAIGWQVSAISRRLSTSGTTLQADVDGEVDGIEPSLVAGLGLEITKGRNTLGLEVRRQRGAYGPGPNVFSFEPEPGTHSRVWSVSTVLIRSLGHPDPDR